MRLSVMGLAEAADELGVHKTTVVRMVQAGRLRPDARLQCGPVFRTSTIERAKKENTSGHDRQ